MSSGELLQRIQILEETIREKDATIQYLENLNEAHNNIILLANEERIEAERTLHAHENIHGIGKLFAELDSEETLKSISSGILEVKQPVASILEDGFLLDHFCEAFDRAFEIERSIVFIREKRRLQSVFMNNITPEDTRQSYFEFSLRMIRQTFITKSCCIVRDKIVPLNGGEIRLSLVCVPILLKSSLVGIIYGDRIIS